MEALAIEELARRISATRLIGALSYQQLLFILERSQLVHASTGDILARDVDGSGSNNHHLLVLKGELDVSCRWQDADGKPRQHTRILKPRPFSGGFAYLSAAACGQHLRALSDVECLRIDADLVDSILEISCQLQADNIADPQRAHLANLFRQVSVVHQLPSEQLVVMVDCLQALDVDAGDEVVTQGDVGDCYYLVESGEAEVWKRDPFSDELERVARLTAGDAFGEEALLQDGMRNASVRMLTPGRLWRLHKQDFDRLLKPTLLAEIDAEQARSLIEQGRVSLLDCRYDIEYEDSRLPGSHHLPLDRLRWDIHTLDPDRQYIVYCRSGRRSKAAAFLMRERNFHAVSLRGGLKDWPYAIDMQPLD